MSKWSSAFRDSRWQKKRLEIMERDKWTCQSCGASGEGVTLNVHHIFYEKGKAPWEYEDEMLVTWCQECHEKRHELQKKFLKHLARLSSKHLDGLSTLLSQAEDDEEDPIGVLSGIVCESHPSAVLEMLGAIAAVTNEAFSKGLDIGWEGRGGGNE